MNRLEEVEFAENPEPRCACVLLLDVSSSMSGEPIKALNEGLQLFQQELVKDELASKRVEVAIVTFGGSVNVVQDFVTADTFEAPMLHASGNTPMGEAIQNTLDMIRDRKNTYKVNKISYYRPWILMLTDGVPTDEWQSASQRVHQEEQTKGVVFFAIGVEGANMNILAQISVREPLRLKSLMFGELFVWLSKSTTSVTHSKVGEMVPLPPPSGWGAIE